MTYDHHRRGALPNQTLATSNTQSIHTVLRCLIFPLRAIAFLEALICVKFGHDLFSKTQIPYVLLWLLCLVRKVKLRQTGSVFCFSHTGNRCITIM